MGHIRLPPLQIIIQFFFIFFCFKCILLQITIVVSIGKWDGLTRLLMVQGVVLRGTNSPGIVSGSPYTNSADDECKSSLGVTLKPNMTHGRSSIQLSPDSLAFNADYNVRWKCSTIPLACG